jgi:hypothetical protein
MQAIHAPPGIERLMRGVVSRSGEHGKHFWQLRLTPGESDYRKPNYSLRLIDVITRPLRICDLLLGGLAGFALV